MYPGFNIAPFRGFYNDIQQGRMIMMDIPTPTPGQTHNIAVVGYHPDGWLIYMDPESGTLNEVSPYGFQGVNYTLTVTRCK